MHPMMEAHHRATKEQAAKLWELLDHPVYDSPVDPEALFPADVTAIAKRGRRSTQETACLGINATKRDIREHERSARKRCNDGEEILRLREYPTALANYNRVIGRLHSVR